MCYFQTEFDEYIATFSKKMGSFLQPRQDLSQDDAMKLGMKNEADEVEKFVQVTNQWKQFGGKDKLLPTFTSFTPYLLLTTGEYTGAWKR